MPKPKCGYGELRHYTARILHNTRGKKVLLVRDREGCTHCVHPSLSLLLRYSLATGIRGCSTVSPRSLARLAASMAGSRPMKIASTAAAPQVITTSKKVLLKPCAAACPMYWCGRLLDAGGYSRRVRLGQLRGASCLSLVQRLAVKGHLGRIHVICHLLGQVGGQDGNPDGGQDLAGNVSPAMKRAP